MANTPPIAGKAGWVEVQKDSTEWLVSSCSEVIDGPELEAGMY